MQKNNKISILSTIFLKIFKKVRVVRKNVVLLRR